MTPAYGIKHWWRNCRLPGESLKAFARRNRGHQDGVAVNTAARWLANKATRKRRTR